jgi:hypothetical protein
MKHSLPTLILAIFTFSFSTSSCDTTGIENALEDFNVVIELEEINTMASVLLIDANTKALVERDAEIVFLGQNKEAIIDLYSDPIQEISTQNGSFNFGIQNTNIPSSENPWTVFIRIEANGYQVVQQPLVLTNNGENHFIIELINISNPPNGITIMDSNVTGQSLAGIIEDSLIIPFDNIQNPSIEDAQFTIPKGTELTKEDGSPFSGPFKIQSTFFDVSDFSAMSQLLGIINYQMISAFRVEAQDMNGKSLKMYSPNQSKSSFSDCEFSVPITHDIESTTRHSLNYIGSVSPLRIETFEANPVVVGSWNGSSTVNSTPINSDDNNIDVVNIPTNLVSIVDITISSPLDNNPVWVFDTDANINVRFNKENKSCGDINTIVTPAERETVTLSIDRNGIEGDIRAHIIKPGFSAYYTIPDGQSSTSQEIHVGNEYRIELHHKSSMLGLFSEYNLSSNDLNTRIFTLNPENRYLIPVELQVKVQCSDPSEKFRIKAENMVSHLKYSRSDRNRFRQANNLRFEYDSQEMSTTGASATLDLVQLGFEHTFKLYFDGGVYTSDVLINDSPFEYVQVIDSDSCS